MLHRGTAVCLTAIHNIDAYMMMCRTADALVQWIAVTGLGNCLFLFIIVVDWVRFFCCAILSSINNDLNSGAG